MGGLGSGRHLYCSSKATTEDYLQVDIKKWHRERLLVAGNDFTVSWSVNSKPYAKISVKVLKGTVVFMYQTTKPDGTKYDYNYQIQIDYISCNYGSFRPWFICPAVGCGRRVAILYHGTIFACRKCFKLSYKSQRENLYDRATRRADKIRERLNWEQGILNGNQLKPKWMHWKTFNKLSRQHNCLVRYVLMGVITKFSDCNFLDNIDWYISYIDT